MKSVKPLWIAIGVAVTVLGLWGVTRGFRMLPDEYKLGGEYQVYRSVKPPCFSMIYPDDWTVKGPVDEKYLFSPKDSMNFMQFSVQLRPGPLHENYLDHMMSLLDETLVQNDSVCERGAFEQDGLLGLYYIHELDLWKRRLKSMDYVLPYGDSEVVHIEFFTIKERFDSAAVQARKMLSSFHIQR